jgi:hypothetical protein
VSAFVQWPYCLLCDIRHRRGSAGTASGAVQGSIIDRPVNGVCGAIRNGDCEHIAEDSSMITDLMDALFGCWHGRFSFPQDDGRGTYVACLDCGSEFHYDFDLMKVGEKRGRRMPAHKPPQYDGRCVENLIRAVQSVEGGK